MLGFPGGSDGKESTCNEGATREGGLIPGSGRSLGGGSGYPPQCSCLQNPNDKGAWWATVHRLQRVGHFWATNTFIFHFINHVNLLQWGKRNTYSAANLWDSNVVPKNTSFSFLGKQYFTEKPVLLVKCSLPSGTWQDWDEWWWVCSGLNWVHPSMRLAGAVTFGHLTGPFYDCGNSRGYVPQLSGLLKFFVLFLLFSFKKTVISFMLLHVDKWSFYFNSVHQFFLL